MHEKKMYVFQKNFESESSELQKNGKIENMTEERKLLQL